MRNRILPKTFPALDESIYAGFWRRLGAVGLDLMIMLTISVMFQSINNIGRVYYYYTIIPSLLFGVVYHIYFVKRWGGTPGKLIMRIKIVRKDGDKAGWREAFLRHVVSLLFMIAVAIKSGLALTQFGDQEFTSLSFTERASRMVAFSPVFHKVVHWTSTIWAGSEFVVLLCNKRQRALHDFIGGTVVIKRKFEQEAEQWGKSNNDV